ncbi:DUF1631 family protein [Pleionea sp. CnH1-48]|uniref:DUF1631 family protein n=1 Tax=Pleionea sp. CnH1-48 TaxID=2954494 RepID=UPI002096BA70|nr:DUF1631 family protein [Pleionea sp. CnH1-48]MCO7224063.1 DUF1631 family protein [Pleionea sp. CnH1-48]
MNKVIFEQSRKARELESKLFREHDKKKALHDVELSAQDVSSVLQNIYRDVLKAPTPAESPLANYEIVQTLYNYLAKDKDFHIPPVIKSSLQLIELSYQFLAGLTEQHEEIQRLMQLMAISWAQLAVHTPEFLQIKQHSSKVALSKILMLGECWDKRGGKLAKKLLEGIRMVLTQLNQKGCNPRLYEQATNRILSLENAFNQYRTDRLKKIVETKRMQEREIKADQFITDYIKEQTEAKEQPVFLLEFMENFLSPYLKKIFMETGPVGQKWHQAIEDAETLMWSIDSPFSNQFVEEYNERVPQALRRLYEAIDAMMPESNNLHDFFYELEDAHIKKLRGERLDYHTMITSPIFEDLDTTKTQPIIVDFSSELDEMLDDDDWYYLIQEGKRFRCQLVPREYTGKWLVFVNLSGALIASIDTQSPSFHPSNLPLVAIEPHNYWEELTEYLERILSRRVRLLEEQFQRMAAEIAADKARKQAAEEEARAQIRKRLEEERERQEAQRRQAEEERAKAIAKARADEARMAQKRLKAKKTVESLMPGAVISYQGEGIIEQQLTLNIISTTTSKYIFTDQKGARRLDPKENDLIELFASGRAKLLEQGEDFEQKLQLLVADQRAAMKDK